jgi:hypothetical protein
MRASAGYLGVKAQGALFAYQRLQDRKRGTAKTKENVMKHITVISSAVPAKALLNHPNLVDSILQFLADPEGVLAIHKKGANS